MLRIGIDIDDVLYMTSQMIRIEGTIIARNLWGIRVYPDSKYTGLREILGLNMYQCRTVAKRLPCTSVTYFNLDAIDALKNFKARHRDVKYYIVSRRSKSSIKRVRQILSSEFGLEIDDGWSCEGFQNKSSICNAKKIDIMLDDEPGNIEDIAMNCSRCVPICCSDDSVLHNKQFIRTYSGYYLADWDNFEVLVGKIFSIV
mgnify:CR=1 FL=1